MRSTLAKVAALIAAGMVVLSGCSTAGDPNVAASVNGQVLSEARVAELSQTISETYLAAWKASQESSQPAASRTPEQQVAYETSLAQQQVKMAPGKYRLAVVVVSIQGQIAAEAAKAANLTVTDDQRKQVIAQDAGLTALSANPVTKDFVSGLADAQVVFNDANGVLAGKDAAARATVKLNPRYGSWDPSQIAPSGSGSLSSTLTAAAE
jgi:hypothetical protein